MSYMPLAAARRLRQKHCLLAARCAQSCNTGIRRLRVQRKPSDARPRLMAAWTGCLQRTITHRIDRACTPRRATRRARAKNEGTARTGRRAPKRKKTTCERTNWKRFMATMMRM